MKHTTLFCVGIRCVPLLQPDIMLERPSMEIIFH